MLRALLVFTLLFASVSPASTREPIRCGIPVGFPSIWQSFSPWNTRMEAFRDKVADYPYMISPGLLISGTWGPQCQTMDQSLKTVYVSTLTAAETNEYLVEFLADSHGTLKLWRDFNPQQEVLSFVSRESYVSRSFPLAKGKYAVIIELNDTMLAGAVAAHFSLHGKMVHRTFPDSHWSAFQFPKSADVRSELFANPEFLRLIQE